MPVHELRRGIGYVIQQAGLFPHRTVLDNVDDRAPPARLGQGAAQRARAASCSTSSASTPAMADALPGPALAAASSSASASPARSPPTRRCC